MTAPSESTAAGPLRVIALTRTSSIGPSTRYRIEQYRDALAAEDIEIITRPLFGSLWFGLLAVRFAPLRVLGKALYSTLRLLARVGQVLAARAGRADLVLVEQQLFPYLPGWVEALLWPRGKATILEFDDAIHLTFAHEAKLARLCSLATVVIVGNRFLADFANAHAARVVIIPTTIDTRRYAPTARTAHDGSPLRIAWIGLPYNLAYLDVLAEPLARLAAGGVPCALHVVSSALPDATAFPGIDLVLRPWSEATEVSEISACDVGVMPLPDTAWARGKCGLKLLQYMASGLPVVASPVGVNADIVRDGENGFLAADAAAWHAALLRLADDPAERHRMGSEGRLTVEREYSLQGGARQVADTYRLACRTHSVSASGLNDR